MTVVPDPLLQRPHVCFLASTCRVPYTRALFLASSPHVFQVCTDDSVCGSGQLCRHALPMYQRLEGVYNIFTKGFADFLGGAGTTCVLTGAWGAQVFPHITPHRRSGTRGVCFHYKVMTLTLT